jgi:lipopolysaccharide export system protein LptA
LATGNVEYTEGARKAFSDQADYDTAEEILVLTGEQTQARLLTGKSWITGKKITLFKAQERVVVESTEENRVEAFFDAEDQDGSL